MLARFGVSVQVRVHLVSGHNLTIKESFLKSLVGAEQSKGNFYCKVFACNSSNSKLSKFETKPVPASLNPVWDEQFVVDLPDDATKLRFSVWDADTLLDDSRGSHEFSLSNVQLGESCENLLDLSGRGTGQLKVNLEVIRKREDISYLAFVIKLSLGAKFEDPEFPPNEYSLYRNTKKPRYTYNVTKWARQTLIPDASMFAGWVSTVHSARPGDVVQGSLGDCWFLGALAAVASRRDYLKNVFETIDCRRGFFQFNFFKNGKPVKVTIDDQVPANSSGTPIFGRCRNEKELWVALIEKAYAKLHGAYETIDGGRTNDALSDLTGEATQIIDTSDYKAELADGGFWKRISGYYDEGFLMACANVSGASEVDTKGMGILDGHAYSILKIIQIDGHQLIKIRNPWGKHEWKGPWADNSSEWEQKTSGLLGDTTIKRKLNVKFEDDGIFHMAYSDFIKYFNRLYVVRLLADTLIGHKWHKFTYSDEWVKGKSSGGDHLCPNWSSNPQFGLMVKKDTKVFISLMQPDRRIERDGVYPNSIVIYLLRLPKPAMKDGKYGAEVGLRMDKLNTKDIQLLSKFSASREISIEVELKPTDYYIIVPCTEKADQNLAYYLSVYIDHGPQYLRKLKTKEDFVSSTHFDHGLQHDLEEFHDTVFGSFSSVADDELGLMKKQISAMMGETDDKVSDIENEIDKCVMQKQATIASFQSDPSVFQDQKKIIGLAVRINSAEGLHSDVHSDFQETAYSCTLTFQSEGDEPAFICRTKVKHNTSTPDWQEVFDYRFKSSQPITVGVVKKRKVEIVILDTSSKKEYRVKDKTLSELGITSFPFSKSVSLPGGISLFLNLSPILPPQK